MKYLRYICIFLFWGIGVGLYAQNTEVRQLMLKLHESDTPVLYNVSDIDSITFTEEIVSENAPFQIKVSEITATQINMEVFPEDTDMPYYFDVITRNDYESVGGNLAAVMEEFIAFLQLQYPNSSLEEIISSIQHIGPAKDEITGLTPETDYYAFAIGLNSDGTCSTQAKVESFKTSKPGDPQKCTFELEVASLSNTSAVLNISPSESDVRYYYDVIPESDYSGDVTLTNRIQSEMLSMSSELNVSLKEVVNALSYYGTKRFEETELQPQTDYVAFAYAIQDDATAAGLLYKVRFTTTESAVSNVDFKVICPKYFNGDDLYASNPDLYASYQGKVIVPTYVEVNPEEVQHWYVGLAAGDLSDTAMYPDDSAISALVDMQGGVPDKTEMVFKANWGIATFLGVAQDNYGVFSKVFRLVIDFDKSNASPVSEFNMLNQNKLLFIDSILNWKQVYRLSDMNRLQLNLD